MKRTRWLLLLLPAALAAFLTWWDARLGKSAWEEPVHMAYELDQEYTTETLDDPFYELLRLAEKSDPQNYLHARPTSPEALAILQEAFAKEGLGDLPDERISVVRGVLSYELILTTTLDKHLEFARNIEAHLTGHRMYQEHIPIHWKIPLPGSTKLECFQYRDWDLLSGSQPRSTTQSQIHLTQSLWPPHTDLVFNDFMLLDTSGVLFDGPLWPLIFVGVLLLTSIPYFLRRPLARLLPARLRPRSTK